MSIVGFVVAWALVAGIVFFVSESAQGFLYNSTIDGLWWRTMAMAVPTALILLMFPCRFDTMFTDHLLATILQPVLWIGLLWLVCGFHLGHAVVLGVVSFFMFGYVVTMSLDSLRLLDGAVT